MLTAVWSHISRSLPSIFPLSLAPSPYIPSLAPSPLRGLWPRSQRQMGPRAGGGVFSGSGKRTPDAAELRDGRYVPGPYRQFWIRDRKPRLVSAAPLHDRVVRHAVMAPLEPWLDRRFIAHSYVGRPGDGKLAGGQRCTTPSIIRSR